MNGGEVDLISSLLIIEPFCFLITSSIMTGSLTQSIAFPLQMSCILVTEIES